MTAAAGGVPPARDDADVAAKQLEAFFLRRLLAEARPRGLTGGGFAGETFSQMLDEALADKLAGAGGVGMSQLFASQLGPAAAAPIASTATAGAGAPDPRDLAHGPALDGMPRLAVPVVGRPSSGYGMRTHPVAGTQTMHAGIDLAAPTGTHVGAAMGGQVVHAGAAGSYGNLVTIRHADGLETRYAHLSEVSVRVGDQVATHQEIGRVGSTGLSTGPHLHFELRRDGKPLDPTPFLPLNRSAGRTNR